MKKFIIFLTCFLILLAMSLCTYATEAIDINTSEPVILDNDQVDNAIEINDYEDFLDSYDEEQQALKEAFDMQSESFATPMPLEPYIEKFVITEVISDIKSEYATNGDYYNPQIYAVKFQEVKALNDDGEEVGGIIILSGSMTENNNVKALKKGDIVYGTANYATSEDGLYASLHHDLTDDVVAYITVLEQDRSVGLILLGIITLALFIIYSGKNGLKALIPFIVALDLIFVVFIPEIALGKNIIILAILIALELIVIITMLKNGWSKKTLVSMVSAILVTSIIALLGLAFIDLSAITGRGIISEDIYALKENAGYIDELAKTTINTSNLYLAVVILLSSVVSSLVISNLINVCEKYAGTDNMVDSILREVKPDLSNQTMLISIIYFVCAIPKYMTLKYNMLPLNNILSSEALVIDISILLFTILTSIISAPISAIVSSILMGKVEIKQIETK